MHFFIALSLLVALSAAHLLHQFWTRSLEHSDEIASMTPPRATLEPEQLKAA